MDHKLQDQKNAAELAENEKNKIREEVR